MTAPSEIWVVFGQEAQDAEVSFAPLDAREKRYLLADLRCWECEKHGQEYCAMRLSHPALPVILRPDSGSVACMSFVPRGGKP